MIIHKRSSATSNKGIKEQLSLEQKGLCKKCQSQMEIPVLDHIFPLGLGGLDTMDNMQLLCIECNLIKNKQDLKDIWNYRKENILNENH